MGLFGLFKAKISAKPKEPFPPTPEWKPEFYPPPEDIIDRVTYYTNGLQDFAVFRHGTCVFLNDNLSDEEAKYSALKALDEVFRYHPDMNPMPMDDGNIMITYNRPVANVVIERHVAPHWDSIASNHLRALARHEVLITPLGPNKFDDFGKKALYGRCFMFMDAQSPEVIRVVRKKAES